MNAVEYGRALTLFDMSRLSVFELRKWLKMT